MDKEKGKDPEALPDEKLDEAAGGLPAVQQGADLKGITDGSSNTAVGGGVLAGMGDGSVRTVKPGI